MKNLLGGKGANLSEMTNIGLNVPPGFIVTTEACIEYMENGNRVPEGLWGQVDDALEKLEEQAGRSFGSQENPLLISVRSGAVVSMPGMMDSILNLGLNDETVKGLAKASKDERFAYDSYRRLVQMYGDVVLGVKHDEFENALTKKKEEKGAKTDLELDLDALKELVDEYKTIIRKGNSKEMPKDPKEQLKMAIRSVFESWDNRRARKYRELHDIPHDLGTAVNVQMMVFGNLGPDSATGVGFTRNPATGDKAYYGEYLTNAQGEDVVAGIRTPKQISQMEEEMPDQYGDLVEVYHKLEEHYKDMQDFEFTIEEGTLYILQTRTGKRTIFAAIKIATDMVDENMIDWKEALLRVNPKELGKLFAPILDAEEKNKAESQGRMMTTGLNASPGGACGTVVFNSDDAEELGEEKSVILVRTETSPEDIGGMARSRGILTSKGGMTSHAAVVARQMGVPCVAGADALQIDYEKERIVCGETVVKAGETIAFDGFDGKVFDGRIAVQPSEVRQVIEGKMKAEESEVYKNFDRVMKWADEARDMGVRTNADTPTDAAFARKFGAQGIGLCRTEHMFFEGKRIDMFRKLILVAEEVYDLRKKLENLTEEEKIEEVKAKLASPQKTYNEALEELLPQQRDDFIGLFKEMKGLPVTIRLLDPPLHEFLPHEEEKQKEMAEKLGVELPVIKQKVKDLSEFNPMLGHRGCRLGITFPEITEMQTRAIMEAACQLQKQGINLFPEIMVPLAGTVEEFSNQKKLIDKVAQQVINETGEEVKYKVGTMIEIPRAALTAEKIAREAEFFSFGTNDLTQMTYGYSRDDAGKFIKEYIDLGILLNDPFQTLDQEGVGQLVEMGTEKGRRTRPDLKVGICGEHGGDPDSIRFCQKTKLDYVSCSPFRVPVARLSAAHAKLEQE